MPKISIIIPIYNVEDYLKQCLDSVVNQTLQDIEIICINSASEDNSYQILQEYIKKDKRITVINLTENLGQGIARNQAIKEANGEYIIFLDADDWLELNACEIAYNEILKKKCDFVKFAYSKYDENTQNILEQYSAVDVLIKNSNNSDIRNTNIDFLRACYSWSQIYNREFLIKNDIKFANLRLCEDVPFIIKTWITAESFSTIRIPLYYYRINRLKNTTNNTDFWKDIFTSRLLSFDIIQHSKYPDLIFSTYFPYCIRTIVNYYMRMSKINKQVSRAYYKEMKKFFADIYNLTKQNKMNSEYEQYKTYLNVLRYNYFSYNLSNLLLMLFNLEAKKEKVIITLFGIKISVCLHNNKAETLVAVERKRESNKPNGL